jgi:hypothetical protein
LHTARNFVFRTALGDANRFKQTSTPGKVRGREQKAPNALCRRSLRLIAATIDAAPIDGRMPQAPGFSFMIIDTRPQQVLPTAPVIDQVAHRQSQLK